MFLNFHFMIVNSHLHIYRSLHLQVKSFSGFCSWAEKGKKHVKYQKNSILDNIITFSGN